jgi:hypothetical protein
MKAGRCPCLRQQIHHAVDVLAAEVDNRHEQCAAWDVRHHPVSSDVAREAAWKFEPTIENAHLRDSRCADNVVRARNRSGRQREVGLAQQISERLRGRNAQRSLDADPGARLGRGAGTLIWTCRISRRGVPEIKVICKTKFPNDLG